MPNKQLNLEKYFCIKVYQINGMLFTKVQAPAPPMPPIKSVGACTAHAFFVSLFLQKKCFLQKVLDASGGEWEIFD
jgi:hypothetical protein